jgi:hypothetical protein
MENKGEIVFYQTEENQTQIEVRLIEDTLWLSLNEMALLFQRDKSVISRHIKKVFFEGELYENSTVAFFATVQNEGSRKIERNIEYFNLDVIISVGYRVNSKRGTQFRIWANSILKDYLIKGYSINKNLLEHQKEKLKELNETIKIIKSINENEFLNNVEKDNFFDLLDKFSSSLLILDDYDYDEKLYYQFKTMKFKKLNTLKL